MYGLNGVGQYAVTSITTSDYAPIQAFVLGRKVRTSQSAVITAKIVAPNAKMTFGRDAAYNGCFCTAQAKSDKHITLTCVE